MIAAVIMGRKGSKGFPGKNLHPVAGKPLAFYPIAAAKGCREIDRIYLTTDDDRLVRLARDNGIDIIERPPELVTDEALGEDVYRHAYDFIKAKAPDIELIVLLMCNAPMVKSEMISEGIRVLRKNPGYDSAVSVSRYNMWSPLRARKIGKDGLLHPSVPHSALGDTKSLSCDRDSHGDTWFADMGLAIIRSRCLDDLKGGLLPQRGMGKRIYPLKQWGGLDVDYEWQIPQVEYWLKNNSKEE